MRNKQIRVKAEGRRGLMCSGRNFTLHISSDIPFYHACRINRATDMLRDALEQGGKLKPWAIERILKDPKWANQYISCLDNNETVRECELLTASMIAEEIVEQAESGTLHLSPDKRGAQKGV